ncbi:hypothetical protein [Roseibium polysiphoniae]|uniref:Uncharacterized protein n=1 Tax=Roseibium polysiphoniae TaxID=2571221 RepID=A0ABR9CFG6_9HYPH|nr:hypothetical protein [Roseibium polysiphoniae]MBD8877656.1 hypothetical protein [Roseibium polysiphoniae]
MASPSGKFDKKSFGDLKRGKEPIGAENKFSITLDGISLDDRGLEGVRNAAIKGALEAAKELGKAAPGTRSVDEFSTFSTFSTFSSAA